MKHNFWYIIIVLALVGCKQSASVSDPCRGNGVRLCAGSVGINPQDVELCKPVIECHDWVLMDMSLKK